MTRRRAQERRGPEPSALNETHDPALESWVASANSGSTHFPIQNLPYGMFRRRGTAEEPRIGVAIGDQVADLTRAARLGLLDDLPDATRAAIGEPSLQSLMALSGPRRAALRRQLSRMLSADGGRPEPRILVPMKKAEMMLPADIGNYTDFYASVFHATNVGRLFRPDNPLLPNYKYVPIAYHGRASSIVISGTPIDRPTGQVKSASEQPAFKPTDRLDYESEIGYLIATGNPLGRPIPIAQAEQHLFGLCLVNDWSARDIQAWEGQPLGPFLAKSFATTISPWIVTLEALAPFRCPAFIRASTDPAPLPHLLLAADQAAGGFDVTIEVLLRSAAMRKAGFDPVRVSRGSLRDMYWTIAQMVTHQTSNGCNLRPGDLLASGTISGSGPGTEGCLLELTRGGPLQLPSGEQRAFLADGDEVIVRAFCERPGHVTIGFGECSGTIRPARPTARV
jgi:fumarylacetoacetase